MTDVRDVTRLLAAVDQAVSAASSVCETESLVIPMQVGKLVAVQVPIAEWTRLIEAAREAATAE